MGTSNKTGEIAARLDRLPSSWYVWRMIVLISLGGVFEFYDLFFTAYVAPGMVKSGLFTPESLGPIAALRVIGQAGFGTFVFATFAGLWAGTLILGNVADRFGRRKIFVWSLVWYIVCSAIMAFQTTGFSLIIWRFIAGIGLGIELVTIDAYIAELIPRRERGRAFSTNQLITYCAVPVVAFLAWRLVPLSPLGFEGWRWVVLIGTVGGVVVWFLQLGLPESPRWLAKHGRNEEAERIVARIEAGVEAELGRKLPAPAPEPAEAEAQGSLAEAFAPEYRSRTIMLSVFNFAQTIGFYGFAAWVPTLLIARGIHITQSLEYAFIIAIANPFGPLIGTLFSDRIERKWQIVGGATGMLILMAIFAQLTAPASLIVVGVLFTLCANVMSYAFHNYQAELFPTRIRARAIGFVYSWSRISAAFAGLAIGYFLHSGGVAAVAIFIGIAMLVVIGVIGFFGPATKELALEQIAH
jgi:MFS transporter, putative metabolite:H+ symporter